MPNRRAKTEQNKKPAMKVDIKTIAPGALKDQLGPRLMVTEWEFK
jgi:hypothetical protein